MKMKRSSTLLLILVFAAAVASCSSPSVCTLVACENGVSVVLTGAR